LSESQVRALWEPLFESQVRAPTRRNAEVHKNVSTRTKAEMHLFRRPRVMAVGGDTTPYNGKVPTQTWLRLRNKYRKA
jgi:hypothetical protein